MDIYRRYVWLKCVYKAVKNGADVLFSKELLDYLLDTKCAPTYRCLFKILIYTRQKCKLNFLELDFGCEALISSGLHDPESKALYILHRIRTQEHEYQDEDLDLMVLNDQNLSKYFLWHFEQTKDPKMFHLFLEWANEYTIVDLILENVEFLQFLIMFFKLDPKFTRKELEVFKKVKQMLNQDLYKPLIKLIKI